MGHVFRVSIIQMPNSNLLRLEVKMCDSQISPIYFVFNVSHLRFAHSEEKKRVLTSPCVCEYLFIICYTFVKYLGSVLKDILSMKTTLCSLCYAM